MKKVFKYALSIVLCFSFLLGISGCNLTESNSKDLYSKVVATAESENYSLKFTREDLEQGFNNFGYSYYQQSGDLKESVKQTIKGLIQRELLLGEIKKIQEVEDLIKSDSAQKEIRYKVFKSIQATLDSYEEQIQKEWDKLEGVDKENESEKASENESEKAVEPTEFNEYKPTLYLDGDVLKFVVDFKFESEGLDVPEKFTQKIDPNNQKRSQEAWVRYISNLQYTAESKGKSIDEKEVFDERVKVLTEQATEDLYFQLYENHFLKRMEINKEVVLQYYKDFFNSHHALYDDNWTAYLKAINSTSEYVYYNYPDEDNSIILVNHILFKFNTDSNDEVEIIKEKKNNNQFEKEEDYYSELKSEADKIFFEYDYEIDWEKLEYKKDSEGNYIPLETKGKKLATEIFELVKDAVNSKSTADEKAKEFNRLICMFSEDTGSVNAKFSYAVSVQDRKFDDTSKNENNWVQTFTDSAIEMFNSDSYKEGDVYSSLVVSEHGYHIMFYNRVPKNIVNYNNINSITFEDLWNTHIDASRQISIFEYIYDSINPDSSKYDKFINELVNTLMNGMEITYFESNYSDLIG